MTAFFTFRGKNFDLALYYNVTAQRWKNHITVNSQDLLRGNTSVVADIWNVFIFQSFKYSCHPLLSIPTSGKPGFVITSQISVCDGFHLPCLCKIARKLVFWNLMVYKVVMYVPKAGDKFISQLQKDFLSRGDQLGLVKLKCIYFLSWNISFRKYSLSWWPEGLKKQKHIVLQCCCYEGCQGN